MLKSIKAVATTVVLIAGVSVASAAPASAGGWIVKFRSQGSQHCLDSNFDGNVYSIACNIRDYQKWVIEPGLESGAYFIRNLKTGRYLEFIGTGSNGVVTKTYSPKNGNQNWYVANNQIRSATSSIKPTLYDEKATSDIRVTYGSVNPVEYGRWTQLDQ